MLVLLVATLYYFGMAGRGIYAAGLAMVNVFGLFFGWSMGRLLVWLLDQSPFTPHAFFKRYNAFLLLIFCIGLCLALASFWLLTQWVPDSLGHVAPAYYWLFFLSLPYYLWFHNGSFFWSAINRLSIQNHLTVLFRSLSVLIPILSCIFWQVSLTVFLGIFCLINLLSFIIELAIFIKVTRITPTLRMPKLKGIGRNSILLHLETISGFLIMSVNVLIMNYFFSNTQVGIYSTATQLINAMVVSGQVGQVMITQKLAHTGKNRTWPVQKRWALACGALSVIGCLMLALILWPLEYYQLIPSHFHVRQVLFLLVWLSPVAFIMSLQLLLTPQWIVRNWIKRYFHITLVTGFINIITLMLFCQIMGFFGVAISMLITFAGILLANIWLSRKTNQLTKLLPS